MSFSASIEVVAGIPVASAMLRHSRSSESKPSQAAVPGDHLHLSIPEQVRGVQDRRRICSLSALAWGGLGHEAICELAFRELDDTARERVIALIQQDEEFTTSARRATGPTGHASVRPSTSSTCRATLPALMTMSARWLKRAW
jgi:hypothetical protein